MFVSYRIQSITLQFQSTGWFLCNGVIDLNRLITFLTIDFLKNKQAWVSDWQVAGHIIFKLLVHKVVAETVCQWVFSYLMGWWYAQSPDISLPELPLVSRYVKILLLRVSNINPYAHCFFWKIFHSSF